MKALLFLLLAATPAFAEQPITGRASVIDGDTIDIHGERIRLNAIDAPESYQLCQDRSGKDYPCGRISADALDIFLSASRPTTCHFEDRDRYGRFVGTCFRSDGAEVNAWMVRQGHAIDFKRYSMGRYLEDQAAAANARSGMWRGSFVDPSEVRRLRRGGS